MSARSNGIGIPERAPVGQRELGQKEKRPKQGLRRSRKERPLSPGEMKMLEQEVMARDGYCCMIDHTESLCDGKTDAHHIIPQRTLSAHYQGSHPIFKDDRNVVALCRHHHNLIERHMLYLPDEALPEGFAAFLNQYGFQVDWEAEIARRV